MRGVHLYETVLEWSGSTGAGYEGYGRAHRVSATGAAQVLEMSADAAFRGDPGLLDPERLLLAAASSCQLLSFLAVAARARLDVVAYRDEACAEMDEDARPPRITLIELRPTITLAEGAGPRPTAERLDHLVDLAHRECYIANTLRAEVRIHAAFHLRERAIDDSSV